jgi:hypothetical protein
MNKDCQSLIKNSFRIFLNKKYSRRIVMKCISSKDLSEETLNQVKNLSKISIDQLKEISEYDQTMKNYISFKLALEKAIK